MERDSDVSLRTDERTEGDQPAESKHRGFWRFWLSLPGFIAAIATLVTALTALAALFVHQNQQLTERTWALDQPTSRPRGGPGAAHPPPQAGRHGNRDRSRRTRSDRRRSGSGPRSTRREPVYG